MDHPSRTEKDKRISKILTVVVVIFITLIFLLRLCIYLIAKPSKTKIEMVTDQNDTFIIYQYDKFWLHHDYSYDIYEKVPGKVFDKKVHVPNVRYGSMDEKITKDDFFYSFIKYRYNNKEVKIYSGKDNYSTIFKVEGTPNYKFVLSYDPISAYLDNGNYSEYSYLVPLYTSRLKNPKEENMRYISGVLILFDATKSFPIIKENINKVNPKEIRADILKYIKNYPKSKETKHNLIYNIFHP